MKTTITSLLFLLSFIISFAQGGEMKSLELGSTPPMSRMKIECTLGEALSFEDLRGPNGILVIFTSNTCPFVVGSKESEGWEGRYKNLYNAATSRAMGMVLINSNEARRDAGESYNDMKAHAREKGYEEIPYAIDRRHIFADAFGAKTTPHCFMFDRNMKLVYKGAIDDNVANPQAVEHDWLMDAMKLCTKNQKVEINTTKAVGCSIKRAK